MADRANWAALVPFAKVGTFTITLAPLTVGGSAGSITFKNGVMTAYVQPT